MISKLLEDERKNLTCWKSEEKYSYNVFISQKQHSSSRACEAKDVLKCARMWPKWFVLWDLSLFLFTPQFIKKTLQRDKNSACLDAVWEFGKKTLSDGCSLMVLETAIDNKGNSAFNPNPDTFNTLFSLSRNEATQWHLQWESDPSEWIWIVEFAGLFVDLVKSVSLPCRQDVAAPASGLQNLQMFWKRKNATPPKAGMVKICFGDFGLCEATHGLASRSVCTSSESSEPQSVRNAWMVRPSTLLGSSSRQQNRGDDQLPKSHTTHPHSEACLRHFQVPRFPYCSADIFSWTVFLEQVGPAFSTIFDRLGGKRDYPLLHWILPKGTLWLRAQESVYFRKVCGFL